MPALAEAAAAADHLIAGSLAVGFCDRMLRRGRTPRLDPDNSTGCQRRPA
jgi:hypothetical protein